MALGQTMRHSMVDDAAGSADSIPANEMPTMQIRRVSSGWTKFMGICAILTFLLFAALITFQVLEWLFYSAPPSVWPPVVK